jgi:excinuclease ABC subunit A
VVVVELDMRVVATADYVIDLGPGAGESGGRVVAAGTPREVAGEATSASAPYLATALDEAPEPAGVGANTSHHAGWM